MQSSELKSHVGQRGEDLLSPCCSQPGGHSGDMAWGPHHCMHRVCKAQKNGSVQEIQGSSSISAGCCGLSQ